MIFLWSAISIIGVLVLSLLTWHWWDKKTDERAWRQLANSTVKPAAVFHPSMVKGLPPAAQKYFIYTIASGTPLVAAVIIEMGGELSLGSKERPNYKPMQARQILAPPYGLVWRLKSGTISGSDGATPNTSWTRFWFFGLIPIVRAGGTSDHHRSAFGRIVSEGAFWVPASLLPSDTVRWEPVDETTARATIHYGVYRQAVDITIAEDGQPTRVVIQRWSNENPERVFTSQPFGGDLSVFKDFDGYRLPTRVDGGNLIGSDGYFPFYKAIVADIQFPGRERCGSLIDS